MRSLRLHPFSRVAAWAAVWLLPCCVAASEARVPAIFVPGVTGSQLVDPASGARVWGGAGQLLRPRDGGYRLALPLSAADAAAEDHPQAAYVAVEPLWVLRLLGFKKEIYRPLAAAFRDRGWQLGALDRPTPRDDFFFFVYDWRRGNQVSSLALHERLEQLAGVRGAPGSEVDLICQSNAAKICRWIAKYGSLRLSEAEAGAVPSAPGYRIRKIVLVGASNGGALRALEQMHHGRRHIRGVGRKMSPEVLFTVRSLFEDLPLARRDLFFDGDGEPLDVDLSQAASWIEYGWSIFAPDAGKRLAKARRRDLFGSAEERLAYLETRLDRSRRVAELLQAESPHFGDLAYYVLENGSQPTIDRALLVRRGERWMTLFAGDGPVDSVPRLADLAVAPGDGHATLSSQQGLSPQEIAVRRRTVRVEGGHFEMVIAPAALEALFGFLAD